MKRSTIIIAALLASCVSAHAGGLAPSFSVVPPQRPAYVPLMELRMPLERCERPVYGRKGQVLYWVGGECQSLSEDGPSEPVSLPAPETPVVPEPQPDPIPEEPPFVEEVPEEEPPVDELPVDEPKCVETN